MFSPKSDFEIAFGGTTVASVQERVIDIVSDQLGVDKEKISSETSFVNDLGADSLDQVELVMELEEEFDINIPDDAAENLQTIEDVIHFTLERRKWKPVDDEQPGKAF